MDVARFRRRLLRWFSKHKRPLPWRRTRDPYAIWVSEVMLQQTTVATVIPYYERFLKRFPTVAALAGSQEDDVLALWSGLGYYSRARNLRYGAQTVMKEHAGAFPRSVDAAMGLKGVGRYTAGAVTSIAYGTRAAVVDGNVRRVLSRVFGRRSKPDAHYQDLAETVLSKRAPGSWNEAMMELGARVCAPTDPRCGSCPVSGDCKGREQPEYWSAIKARRRSVEASVELALARRRNHVLLARVPAGERMEGLYELPNSGLQAGAAPARWTHRYPGLSLSRAMPLAAIRHNITHHRIKAVLFTGTIQRAPANFGLLFHPISQIHELPLTGITRKAFKAVGLLP